MAPAATSRAAPPRRATVLSPVRCFGWRGASLVVVLVACHGVAVDVPVSPASVELSPALFLSSKTPYYPQQHYSTYETMPAHCHLVHINHLGRHGSRHSTKLKAALHLYDALAEALRLGKLKPRGVVLLQSVARFAEAERDRLGACYDDAALSFSSPPPLLLPDRRRAHRGRASGARGDGVPTVGAPRRHPPRSLP